MSKHKHGYCTNGITPEYKAWQTMKDRCQNPNNKRFHKYGGRGIKVCEQWHDFLIFLRDVGTRPSKSHSLDRIDNDGNYEPGNCRWANGTQQAANRSSNSRNTSGFRGVSWHKKRRKWMAYIMFKGKSRFLGQFNSPEQASIAYETAHKARLMEV